MLSSHQGKTVGEGSHHRSSFVDRRISKSVHNSSIQTLQQMLKNKGVIWQRLLVIHTFLTLSVSGIRGQTLENKNIY